MKTWNAETNAVVVDSWGKFDPGVIAQMINAIQEASAREWIDKTGDDSKCYSWKLTTGGGVVWAALRLGLITQQEHTNWYKSVEKERSKVKPLRESVLKRDGYKCLKCGSTSGLNIDHINPVAFGGLTEMDNLQTLCRSCNLNKLTGSEDYRNQPA